MSVARNTVTVGGLTLVSRVLGLARDVVFAYLFAASAAMDAFFVAFKIPNFFRRLFGEGAFSQAFVPVFGEYHAQRGEAEVRALVARVAGALGGVLLLIIIVGVLFAQIVIFPFAAGFYFDGSDQYQLAADMLRWTFPYLGFVSLCALAAGVLNTFGRFAIPAVTPVLLNLVLIVAAIWLSPQLDRPVMGLAIGVFVAGVVQLGFQLPALARIGMLPAPRLDWSHQGVRRVLRLLAPAAFGASVAQISLLLDTLIATFLITGSVSWLYYSDRLMEFPLGVFAIALATVILPKLSREHAAADPEAFSATLDHALRLAMLLVLPAAVGLFLLAEATIITVFGHGAFGARDAGLASWSLMAYSVGLIGFTLIKILAPGFFARQDTRTPVRIGLIALAVNLVLNLGFAVPLYLMGFEQAHAGLALATGISATVNAGLLFRALRRDDAYRPAAGWSVLAGRGLLANAVMAGLLLLLRGDAGSWIALAAADRVIDLLALIAAGAAVYFAVLFGSGFRMTHLNGAAADPTPV
jgi:putative peptidoglycan lipid II flippase